MKIKILLPLFVFTFCSVCTGQDNLKVIDLLNEGRSGEEKQMLVIKQDSRIDTLVTRHIFANARKNSVKGYRIQIFRGGHRTAQDEANKTIASFIDNFPEYPEPQLCFEKPNWFKVKVGDFATREEAAVVFYKILQKYPDAYLIKDDIRLKNAGR